MSEALYAEHPEVYDALYREKEYDAEVAFAVKRLDDPAGARALVVGCGTGEHARRLVDRGVEVVGVDRYAAMVERARTKSDATFRVDALPDLSVAETFDLVWLPFTVVNHLDPDELEPALDACADRVADGGLLLVDSMVMPEEGAPPGLRSHRTAEGSYARLAQVHRVDGRRYRWDSVVFTPDGEFFVDVHDLTDFEAAELAARLEERGFAVEAHDGYAGADPSTGALTVVVARRD